MMPSERSTAGDGARVASEAVLPSERSTAGDGARVASEAI
jgi:hypothetical protein